MRPTRLRRRLERAVRELDAVHPLADRGIRRRAAALRVVPAHDVVVAAPGAGNIGDRAMLEALTARTSGRSVVVVRNPEDLGAPLPGARVVALPDLLFGGRTERRRDLAAYLDLVEGACSVTVIGADMLDGRYTLPGSVRRTLLAELAASAGVPTRLVGFSWNAGARPSAVRAVRRAAAAGAVPLLRDPASAERIRRAGVDAAVDTADVVFSVTTADHGLRGSLGLTGRYAIVNVSGLVGRAVDQVPEYVRIVRHLMDQDLTVVLLPHVLRGSSDDLFPCAAVRDAVDDPRVLLIARTATPDEVRALTDGAAVVVTGRMHLAVMAMSTGVPAITLATQGKVEGMMQRFGLPELCIAPRPGFGDAVVAAVGPLLASDDARSRIAEALPAVRELAERNFAHFAPVDRRDPAVIR